MSARFWVAAAILAAGAALPRNEVPASAAALGVAQEASTTLDDQVELAVTVYNSDVALVRDVRNLTLARGTSDLRFMDIAATVNPSTVHFRSLTEPSRVGVLEQNRVREKFALAMADEARPSVDLAASPRMAQEAFSEYHLYTLGRKTTINNSETKQVSMLEATGVAVQKRYVVNGQAFYYRNPQHPGAPIKDLVRVYYQFRNEEQAGLGIPMPSGIVRIYQNDSKGGVQFVGEDRIDHTPKDETLNLQIGNAFDVVAERRQIDFEKIAPNVYEMEYEVTLRNHKPSGITIEVNEPIGGTWRMLRSSHEWTKSDAWAAQFKAAVAADATSVVKYRVRVTF